MAENPAQPPLAVVTGSAHRVGREIALGLARRGYAIGLHYHHAEEEARRTADEVRTLGVPVLLLPADLTDEDQIRGMFRQVDEQPCELQVLVNSAAVMPRADLRSMSSLEWDKTLALNLRAPWLCAREAARRMPQGSLIVNVSDAGVSKVWTGFPVYVISKAGLETLTRLLAKSLAPAIRVNAIAPGLILKSEDVSEEEWARLIQRLPLKQPGKVENLVKAVLFLLDDPYVTGQTLVVDGGYQLT